MWTAKEESSKAALTKAGVTFINDVNRDEFAAVEKPLWDKIADTPELKQLVKDIVETR